MKKLIQLCTILFLSLQAYAGGGGGGSSTPGPPCSSATQFCAGSTTFANSTNVSSLGGGGIYGCLSTTPNPAWFYMEIASAGNITLQINQTSNNGTPIDVDFALWGPFTSLSSGCNSLSASNNISCSYSTSASETATITNAQPGQTYIMLLTNYANSAGSITFSQSGGSGSTNCSFLCSMTGVTATPGACVPATGQYGVTGQITFQHPPATGTLTVTSSCGGSVNVPGPWTSPMSYSIPGITANGGQCTVTAAFSADPSCTVTQAYTSPVACSGCTVTAGNSGPVCSGGTVNLTSTTVTGASGYSWTGPNGYTSTSQNPTGVTPPTAAGTYVYTVTAVFNGVPCTSSTTVTVNAMPTVNAGQDVAVCAGQPVTLSATGAATYTWNNNITNGVAFTPTANGTYTVTGTTAAGCVGTDEVMVTVNPLPTVTAGNDLSICEGASISLSGGGAATYAWDNGVTNGLPFSPPATATYTVIGTDINGCTGTDQAIVSVTLIPVVSFVPDATAGCSPLTVNFTDQTTQGNTSQWIFGDGKTDVTNGTATNTYFGAGCFDVTLISTTPDGCVGQTVYPSLICVSQVPRAEFLPNPSILNPIEAYSTMQNSSVGATSYIWDFGDNSLISTQTSPTHIFPSAEAGTYQVTLIAINEFGCRDTSYATVIIEDQLIYYVPNAFTPDDDQFNPVFKPVFTTGFDPYDYTLLIFNRWGEVIFESHDAKVGWNGTYGEGGSLVPDGSYTWKIDFKTTKTDERKMIIGNVTLIR